MELFFSWISTCMKIRRLHEVQDFSTLFQKSNCRKHILWPLALTLVIRIIEIVRFNFNEIKPQTLYFIIYDVKKKQKSVYFRSGTCVKNCFDVFHNCLTSSNCFLAFLSSSLIDNKSFTLANFFGSRRIR